MIAKSPESASASNNDKFRIGLDVGSVSVNAVLIGPDDAILEDHYVRTHGQPVQTTLAVLADMLERTSIGEVASVVFTGSGGRLLASILEVGFVNEIVAQGRATMRLYPEVRTVIEMGGEDSKLLLIDTDPETRQPRVKDFAMNMICAAGTGSFLDQQANRLGVSIEGEFGEMALRSEKPPRIAGRCSVFAKTDMIHLQQEATPMHDIMAGLCFALARNYKGNIAKNRDFVKPVSFQGGVAANVGMVRAFEDVLELKRGELVIPEHHASMGAIGAAFVQAEAGEASPLPDLHALREYLSHRQGTEATLERLDPQDYPIRIEPEPVRGEWPVEAYVGVDVGSISTNVVVMDKDRRVLARRYLMTAGRPLDVVTQGLYEVGVEVGDKVKVCGCGTTGSGRYLTRDFIGADMAINEITTHARAAAHVNPKVDTIFEIGGQDSKYVSLRNGAVVDFTMNKVCAAGTGSFLEEQAEKLGVNIKEEFGGIALSCAAPAHLGERCTVFMESDLNHCQQKGVSQDALVAGLCYSIVFNYLNRVVEERPVGDCIFFQGGTAYNRGVKAAFEKVTGKKVIVPPHHDCMGAIGAAMVAQEENTSKKSSFKGFDLRNRKYNVTSFDCKACANLCEVRRVSIEGEKPLHYGSRCGKYDEEKRRNKGAHLPRLFHERQRMLTNAYAPEHPAQSIGKTVGIPRITHYFEMFPLYKAFFMELGLEVVTSSETSRSIVQSGLENIASETCFPIKVAHGHVLDLLDKGVDYLWLPSVINMEQKSDLLVHSFACPYVQAIPYLIESAIDLARPGLEVLKPALHFEHGREEVSKVLTEIGRKFTRNRRRIRQAIERAWEAMDKFRGLLERRGAEVLDKLNPEEPALVIVSRPYNGCDTGLNLNLPDKLRELGVLAIPMDFLPLDQTDIVKTFPDMYWKYGQRILGAARIVRQDPRLNAIYVTNFGCGPDSFISKFFTREMGDKPYLTIEIDEHSADVGAMTRCEAFLDSLKNVRASGQPHEVNYVLPRYDMQRTRRKLYIPYMDDHGYVVAAAMRACGVNGEQLPMSDERSLELGRKYTSGKECYPCTITTGDILRKVFEPDFDRANSSFFMPVAYGPCRFGQYNKFHRMVLDDLGYSDVPIIVMDQTKEFDADMKNLGPGFHRPAWQSIIYVDFLQKLLRETRPYELNRGECDKLYARFLKRAVRLTENGLDLRRLSRLARRAFERVPVDRSPVKPRIGLVGEIYVRSNPFSNNFIVEKIEALGGEVVLPTLQEWIFYITYCRREEFTRQRDFRGLARQILIEMVQNMEVRKISRIFKGSIRFQEKEPPSRDVLDKGNRYIHETMKGEAVLSMGRAVEYAEDGFDGVVNLAPFNCLPGTIVNALLDRFRKDHGEIPVLKVAYDGLKQLSEDTRLEAFIHQTRQRALSRAARRRDAVGAMS